MRKNFVFILIFALGVEMYLSQDEFEVTTEGYVPPNPMHSILGPLEPFSFDDFKKPPEFDERVDTCHKPHMKCLSKLKGPSIVCAFVRNYGLVSFNNMCGIHIQNCLVQPLDTDFVYGVPTIHDNVYYNNKKHDCYYYVKKAKNQEDAVRLYYKAGYEIGGVSNDLEDKD